MKGRHREADTDRQTQRCVGTQGLHRKTHVVKNRLRLKTKGQEIQAEVSKGQSSQIQKTGLGREQQEYQQTGLAMKGWWSWHGLKMWLVK